MPNGQEQQQENSYKAARDNKKQEEQQAAEKAGALAARGALDYATGGKGEQLRKMPVVGNRLKKLENKVGKRVGKLDKKTGGNLGKISKKADDAGLFNAADKGLSMVGGGKTGADGLKGGAKPGSDAMKGGNAPKSGGNKPSSPNSGGNSPSSGGGKPSNPFSNPFGGKKDSSSGSSLGGQSESSDAQTSGNIDIASMLLKNKKVKYGLILVAFFSFMICAALISVITASSEDGSGDPAVEATNENGSSSQSASAEKLLQIAESQLGNNEANGTHAKYLSFLGFSPSTAWCAAFVSWCAKEAGIDEQIIPHTAAVKTFLAYFKKAGVFKDISSGYKPALGDLIIWQANNSNGHFRSHIGIVKEYNSDTGKLITIEGNSSNAVRENTYTFSTLKSQGVVGFAHPNYPTSSSSDDNSATNLNGKTITLPSGLGTYATREFDLASTTSQINYSRSQIKCCKKITNPYAFPESSSQRKVQNKWIKEGAKHDSNGFCKLQGRYIVATTATFGSIGDKVDFYMSNGTVVHVVLGEEKSQKKTWYDPHPANKWGHGNGKNVLEFMGKKSIGNDPYYSLGLHGKSIVKAVNGGSIFK